jgi:hypothetical protein
MRQCLALLMLCVLLLSHGSMGEAVPHLHAHDVAHVDVHHDDEAVSHDAGETDVELSDAADSNSSDDGTAIAAHAHVTGDLSRPVEWRRAPLVGIGPKLVMASVSALPSRGVPPLLEPPAA